LIGEPKKIKYSTYEAVDIFGEIVKGELAVGNMAMQVFIFYPSGYVKERIDYYDNGSRSYHNIYPESEKWEDPWAGAYYDNLKNSKIDTRGSWLNIVIPQDEDEGAFLIIERTIDYY
jgi:hypothetical protein